MERSSTISPYSLVETGSTGTQRAVAFPGMRVGVYIDGFNLYYGGKFQCGPGTSGWRWLDLRALATRLITNNSTWTNVTLDRIVYCTARISGRDNPIGAQEQDAYLRALDVGQIVDHTEHGTYVTRAARGPLATPDRRNRPVLTTLPAGGSVMVKNAAGVDEPHATFMVTVARREEKGSDVNVAAHLLWDILRGQPGSAPIEAAVVISNDTDLKLPISQARQIVPIGIVNPTKSYTAGALKAPASAGVGNHWWYQMRPADFHACQLADPTAGISKPSPW